MNAPRKFRFGVLCRSAVETPRAWKNRCRKAEDLGYDILLVADHLDGPDWAPVPALVLAGEATGRIRLGCHVFNNDLRHPAVLARDLAAVDHMSDGRLEVGLGAGWKLLDYTFRGEQPDEPLTRIERLEEAVRAVKALLARQHLTMEGKYYSFRDFRLSPPALQHPRPPVSIGGGGRRVLELAAKEADIVSVNLRLGAPSFAAAMQAATWQATTRKVAWVREAATTRQEAPEQNIVVHFVIVGDDAGKRADQVARSLGMTAAELKASPHALVGSVEGVVERLEEQRAELGITYFSIPDRCLEEFAPVLQAVAGR